MDLDYRFDQIESDVQSRVNDAVKREIYQSAFSSAASLLQTGSSPDLIRQKLSYVQQEIESSSEDSAVQIDAKEVRRRIEAFKAQLTNAGIQDALNGLGPSVPKISP